MFFKQQNRESATLAFSGLVYKFGKQEGCYYPDAHMQRIATQQYTRPKSLIQDSSSVTATGLLISEIDQTPVGTNLNTNGTLGAGTTGDHCFKLTNLKLH